MTPSPPPTSAPAPGAPVDGTTPIATPNPATQTWPERSSTRVAHRASLAWLPWLLVGLLALLVALAVWAITEAGEHDRPDRPATGAASDPGRAALPTEDASGVRASGLGAAALIGGGGLAAERVTGSDAATDLAGTVLFGEGSAAIDAAGRKVVAAAADAIRAAGARHVVVKGYTDVIAGQPVNKPLSVARATNTAHALHQELGNEYQVTASGLGERDPVASNATAAGRLHNRRAVIHAT